MSRRSFIRKSLKKHTSQFHPNSLGIDIVDGKKITKCSVDFKYRWEDISPACGRILSSLCNHSIESDMEVCVLLENTLNKIIELTRSEIGNIAILENWEEEKISDQLVCLALGESITGTITPGEYSEYQKSTKSLFGKPIKTGRVIIINNYSKLNSSHTLPDNHPTIKTFLGIPLSYQKRNVGILALSNADFYNLETIKEMLPLLSSLNALVVRCLNKKETLASAVRAASEVDEIKDRFLATVSHELRTPLNGIMGMTTMLGDAGPLNKKQCEYVQNLTECSIQLANLLNNILDFSKMAADRLSLQKKPIDVTSTIVDCARMFEGNIKAKGLAFDVSVQEGIPTLMGDSQRLIQILQNLLSNAYKFTEKGGISLSVEASPLSSRKAVGKWKVIFSVSDTGVGIPEEEQDKIFETFHQVSTTNTYNSVCGTGLGLSIARELVRLMNGKISLSSKVGEGSTFNFYIILNKSINIENMSDLNQNILKDKRVLVIDDRPEMRLQLADMMFRWHCVPHTVTSAEEALQCLQYGMTFDVALVDICMPGMSGIELAQELRHLFPALPLIGISSAEVKSGVDYFDHYMYKPVDQNVLFSALIDCLQVKRKRRKKKRKSKRNLRILITEDDVHNIYTLREMLMNLGFRKSNIKVAHDGLECISMVNKATVPYDAILMDIKMPKMGGLEATRIIKKDTPSTFILAVSAAVQPTEKAKGQRAGIDGYLSKPLLKDKLECALLPLIKDKRIK